MTAWGLRCRRISHSPPKDTAGSSSISVVIKAKKSCPVSLLLARWTKLLCRARASRRSGANMMVSFSLTLLANGLGSLCLVMRGSLLHDVLCASHIIKALLMMSKTSDNSAFPSLILVSLMHMDCYPPSPQLTVGHIFYFRGT